MNNNSNKDFADVFRKILFLGGFFAFAGGIISVMVNAAREKYDLIPIGIIIGLGGFALAFVGTIAATLIAQKKREKRGIRPEEKISPPPEQEPTLDKSTAMSMIMVFSAVFLIFGGVGCILIQALMIGFRMILSVLAGVCLLGGAVLTIVSALKIVRYEKNREAANAKSAAKQDATGRTADFSALLRDPRVRELPEIQRLLQYPTVQRVFFEGRFPGSPEELDEPNIRELRDILSRYSYETELRINER